MAKVTITGLMPAYSDKGNVSYPESHTYEIDDSELYDAGVIMAALRQYCNGGNAGHIIKEIKLEN